MRLYAGKSLELQIRLGRSVKILKIGQSAGNLDILYFKKALRDYTPHAQTVSAVGDEIVQTTTLKSLAAGESQSGM